MKRLLTLLVFLWSSVAFAQVVSSTPAVRSNLLAGTTGNTANTTLQLNCHGNIGSNTVIGCPSSIGGAIRNLYAYTENTSPGGTDTVTVKWCTSAFGAALVCGNPQCTITGAGTNCSDTTNVGVLAPGAQWAFQLVSSATSLATRVAASVELDP